ncbi:sulfite exporter TauE/SafE family protein [Tepidibacillus marianensis]|uniref:sulfite exporter TauE/SafE family protein n=1 Tax=Tepidibacillus marianensis TaxID=3131995 RepID=UPI0030D16822
MNTILSMFLSSIIIFFASSVQGATGFAFALIIVPLLSFFLPLKAIVPISIVLSLVINTLVIISGRKLLALKEIWILIVTGIIGIPFGIYLLNTMNLQLLKIIIGLLLIITSFTMYKGLNVHFKNKGISHSITGFISGVLNGSISMSGPPIVLFLANEGYEKDSFRTNMNAYSIITNIIAIAVFAFNGFISNDVIRYSGINIIVTAIGTLLGIRISGKINETTFKKVIFILLIITGVITIVNSF